MTVPAADAGAAAIRGSVWEHLRRSRWFAGKGRPARLGTITALPWLVEPRPARTGVRPEVATVRYDDATEEHYLLLLSYGLPADGGPADGGSVGWGSVDLPDWGRLEVGDAFATAQTRRLIWQGLAQSGQHRDGDRELAVIADQITGGQADEPRVELFAGEQSNTSLLIGDDLLLKVFRRLEPGRNLDIEVHAQLAAAGSTDCAVLHGWCRGRWTDPAGTVWHADLTMLVEQLTDAEDGWRLATRRCTQGRSFAPEARDLGRVLHRVHRVLDGPASGQEQPPHHEQGGVVTDAPLGTTVSGSALAARWIEHLDRARAAVPALDPHVPALRERCLAVATEVVPVQRVHGDLHLGQALLTPDGWKIIDFEGEPGRSMAERRAPDSRWRDVAGVLRSLRYATSGHQGGDSAARATAWAEEASAAFLAGYREVADRGEGTDSNTPAPVPAPDPDLPETDPSTPDTRDREWAVLRGYLIDRAVYEVVYEARNRPSWVDIPLRDVARLAVPEAPTCHPPIPGGTTMSMPGLSALDLSGFHSGGDQECWRRLGAVPMTIEATPGTRFSVWAPHAQQVRLVGDFNGWHGEQTPMDRIEHTGVWACFVPGVGHGALYKFEVLGADGSWRLKADPMARFCESAPHNASIVFESQYQWGDDEWLWYRGERQPHAAPMSIYEVHLGSWRQGLTYLDLADQLVAYVTEQGFTHVEFLPVAEHPYRGSWGYHVTGFFAPASRFGDPDQFRHLVDRLHRAGIGVIVDWVPGHFATDEWALARFDGTPIYEHPDPRRGWHPDWGSWIFDFGRPEVKSFLVSNAYWWVDQFHIDALRVDAVASMLYLDYSRPDGQWTPNRHGGRENLEAIELLQTVNSHLYGQKPGVVMIAEESTSWPGVTRPVDQGGLGFGFKWNMGWMNDSLRFLGRKPVHRPYHLNEVTFAMVYAYSENFILPISHDEVVHGKGSMLERVPEDDWRRFATLKAFYAFQWSHPGKQLLFMGTEFGQRREFDEERSLDWQLLGEWGHRGVHAVVRDLNGLYARHPALWARDSDPGGFRWIDADDARHCTLSYLRFDGDGEILACVVNFSDVPRTDHRIGLPAAGVWTELLNTDAAEYDGTGDYGNLGAVSTATIPSHGFDQSAAVTVGPLAAVFLRYDPDQAPDGGTGDVAEVTSGQHLLARRATGGRLRRRPRPEEVTGRG